MAIKEFKTESKRLLDLMANSIYTNTDIFLREIISNASDAIDKRNFLSLQNENISKVDGVIELSVDKDAKTITISDNGIGMNKEDLENNLGTIAKSGSYDFKQNIDEKDEMDIIGQFGVGFYSGFMVADSIEVITKKCGEEKAYSFTGTLEGYEIKSAKKDEDGTKVILHIKENTKEKKYDKYFEESEIKSLVKKYSDFISYPIKLKDETLNTMSPIWKKNKKDIKDNEYEEFYEQTYYDYNKPLKTLHYKVEGNTSYTALLYIPSKRPYNYFTSDYKLGLKLYSRGVFIKDEAKEIVSDYFKFVRGVVDSDDISLNISREILQEDHQMEVLKKSIDKKIKSTLEKMLKDDRDTYNYFFEEFGQQLKFGCYDNFGMNKDILIDLIMFKSTKEDKYVTLKEYVANMKEDQKEIYYATGESIDSIKELPQIEKILDKGYEVLYFTDNIDEFMAQIVNSYDGKTFKSILSGDLDIDTEEEKKDIEKKKEDSKGLIDTIKEVLKDDVADVKISNRLKSQPVCLVSDEFLSIDMEKYLKAMNQDVKANKILEINPDHELFKALSAEFDKGGNIDEYARLLYDQALLIAGLNVKDPVKYTERITSLMLKSMEK